MIMKISLQIPRFTWPGEPPAIKDTLTEIARATEKAGFSSIWTMDHFFQIEMVGSPEEPMLEGYSTLSFLAALTKRVQLGTMVTGVVYRHPGVLIKTVTTLDVLSGGRAILGIGAAWFEREAVGLGVPFPPLRARFEQLEEALQIAKLMWSGKVTSFNGKHYQLAETLNSPQPISSPHPPILIGGSGEKKTLRLVAEYADACNLFAFAGIEVLTHKFQVLKKHCQDIGRPYEDIERTVLGRADLASGTESVLNQIQELAEIGVQHIIYSFPNVQEITPLERFGEEVIPAIADL
jgi:F420-dependent oxidoreductase-like protein